MPASYKKYTMNERLSKGHDFKIRHFFSGRGSC